MSNETTEPRGADALAPVSVIVPVYNDEGAIGALIESLLAQDYPREKVEIILVDNGSTDRSRQVIQRYPVTLLEERDVQSSYAARNRGIRAARYELLAFIDSDCVAVPSWLAEGIRTLRDRQADLVGGRVEFTFASETPSAAELYDSLIHFNFEQTIAQQKGTGAGNLFTSKQAFEQIGYFPPVRSGGDFQWTGKAMAAGLKAVFSPTAVIRHPARRFREILKKQWRTGTGFTRHRLAQGHGRLHEFFYLPYRVLSTGIPVARFRREVERDGRAICRERFWRIVAVAWLCILVHRLSAWVEFMKILFKGKRTNE